MPLTSRRLLFALVGIAVLGSLGLVLLGATYDNWVRGQLLLTRGRTIPRLVSFAVSPVEFSLRCAFSGLLALCFFSTAVVFAVSIIQRLLVLRDRFFSGEFQSGLAARLMLIPLASVLAWLVLLCTLPFVYD